jgi:anti-sigma factor RsiW
MIELTDELLVAFADGELSAETSAAVQAQVSRDPEAQGKVKDMQDTAALLWAAFGDQGCSVLQFKRLGSRKASPDGG